MVFQGQHQHLSTEDECPRPLSFRDVYSKSKSLAEEAVLDANSVDMATIAIRPHCIFGP